MNRSILIIEGTAKDRAVLVTLKGIVTRNKIFSCEQIDECSNGMNECDVNAICSDLDGGYD